MKELLECIWNMKGCINACHINLWSVNKRGIYFGTDIWCSKGRKVAFKSRKAVFK